MTLHGILEDVCETAAAAKQPPRRANNDFDRKQSSMQADDQDVVKLGIGKAVLVVEAAVRPPR